jgi:hypothetical protein
MKVLNHWYLDFPLNVRVGEDSDKHAVVEKFVIDKYEY